MRAAASSVTPSGPAGEGVIVRAGVSHKIRTCPGTGGAPCLRSPPAWLRGKHDVCGACVERATVWNGLVDVAPVRAHLQWLSEQGVGYKSVADAAKVGHTLLAEILAGRKTKLRAQNERAILAVAPTAIADHALVSAHATWDLIRRLLAEGLTRGQLANLLGRQRPALQLRREAVLASTALEVRQLFDRIMDLGSEAPPGTDHVLEILRVSCARLTVTELADMVRPLGARHLETVELVVRSLVRLRALGKASRRPDARRRVHWFATPVLASLAPARRARASPEVAAP